MVPALLVLEQSIKKYRSVAAAVQLGIAAPGA